MEELLPLLFLLNATPQVPNRIKEQELKALSSLVLTLLDYIEQRLKPEDHNSPVGRLIACNNPADAERVAAIVDKHLADGKTHLALRTLHDETGHTWDEVHQVVAEWKRLGRPQKQQWVRFARLLRVAKTLDLKPTFPSA